MTKIEREELDKWLSDNCGKGIPHGEATEIASMLHGLAYILRQIEGTDSYKVNIGQTISARTALRFALDHFAKEALRAHNSDSAEPVAAAVELLNGHRNWSLSFHEKVYGDDDDLPTHGKWVVWEETGNINDREWLVAGAGETAKEAIMNAVRAQ